MYIYISKLFRVWMGGLGREVGMGNIQCGRRSCWGEILYIVFIFRNFRDFFKRLVFSGPGVCQDLVFFHGESVPRERSRPGSDNFRAIFPKLYRKYSEQNPAIENLSGDATGGI